MKKYYKSSIKGIIDNAAPKPIIELTPERIEKLKTCAEVMLAVLKFSAVLTMVVVAPNALQALTIFEKKRGRRPGRQEKIRKVTRTFYYLKKKNYIEFKRNGNNYEIKFTKRGNKIIRKLEIDSLTIPEPKNWDGKFWLVAADIPTKKYRGSADMLRNKIKELGFYPLQRTLWIHPYDPRIEIEFIARYYEIDPFVTVMKIDSLDPSDLEELKAYFKNK